MPFISDAQISRLQSSYESVQRRAANAKKRAEEKAGEIKQTLEVVGAAAGVGALRGKMEEADGSFNIPGTSIDIELVIGMGLLGASMMDLFGKYDEDVLAVGNGIMAHYIGQVARHWTKTGSLSMVAGRQFPGQGYGAYAGLPRGGYGGTGTGARAHVGADALSRALAGTL
jgi:hypothetical protein